MFRKKGRFEVSVFLVLGFLLFWTCPPGALSRTLDRVVATVDEEVITQSELQEAVELFLHQIGQAQERPPSDPERKALERRVLEDMIDKKLLEEHAKEAGVKATEEEIDRAVEDVLSRAGLTQDQLEEALKRDGIPKEEYRDQIRNQIVKAKVIHQEVRNRVDIKDADVEGYYLDHKEQFRTEEGVELRHILLPIPKNPQPGDEEGVYREALRIRGELLAGMKFEDAAAKYSKDASASQGGWLGFFGKGAMSPEMEKFVWGLKQGEVSEPVRSAQGFHLVRVEERTTGEVRPLDKVRDQIREKLYEESAEREFEEWRKELRKNAHIEVFL
jgi:peptidyl-prolyl cis-trans isomerase SurA